MSKALCPNRGPPAFVICLSSTDVIYLLSPSSLLSSLWWSPPHHSYHHSVGCLTTSPLPLPKRVLHRARSSASSFSVQYPTFSLRSSIICLRLLRCLPVTYILPSSFPSITCLKRQFLSKMWPIQSAFLLFIICRTFPLCLTYVILFFSCDQSNRSSPSSSSAIFRIIQGISAQLPEVSNFQHRTKLWSKWSTNYVCTRKITQYVKGMGNHLLWFSHLGPKSQPTLTAVTPCQKIFIKYLLYMYSVCTCFFNLICLFSVHWIFKCLNYIFAFFLWEYESLLPWFFIFLKSTEIT
jgi:hypothetical protein